MAGGHRARQTPDPGPGGCRPDGERIAGHRPWVGPRAVGSLAAVTVCRRLVVVAFAAVALLVAIGGGSARADQAGPDAATSPLASLTSGSAIRATETAGSRSGASPADTSPVSDIDTWATETAWARSGASPAEAVAVGAAGDRAAEATGSNVAAGTAPAVDPGIGSAGRSAPAGDLRDHGQEWPCVIRADCAGALVLGGLGLVLALPAVVPSIGALVPTGLVATPSGQLPLALRATRLYRPPRLA